MNPSAVRAAARLTALAHSSAVSLSETLMLNSRLTMSNAEARRWWLMKRTRGERSMNLARRMGSDKPRERRKSALRVRVLSV